MWRSDESPVNCVPQPCPQWHQIYIGIQKHAWPIKISFLCACVCDSVSLCTFGSQKRALSVPLYLFLPYPSASHSVGYDHQITGHMLDNLHIRYEKIGSNEVAME